MPRPRTKPGAARDNKPAHPDFPPLSELPYLTRADGHKVYILPPESDSAPDLDPDTNPAIAAFCDTVADIIMGALGPDQEQAG